MGGGWGGACGLTCCREEGGGISSQRSGPTLITKVRSQVIKRSAPSNPSRSNAATAQHGAKKVPGRGSRGPAPAGGEFSGPRARKFPQQNGPGPGRGRPPTSSAWHVFSLRTRSLVGPRRDTSVGSSLMSVGRRTAATGSGVLGLTGDVLEPAFWGRNHKRTSADSGGRVR
jgi:hypothetical protein